MQPSPSFEHKAPRLVSQTHYCVMGDVTVADGVAIAPGVVLQASPGSRIVIAAGACLAGGVCLQSRQGVLTIGAGANLGANVLVVGKGMVGANACISPGSTLMNPQVETEALVPPSSLVVASTAGASSAHTASAHTASAHTASANHSSQAKTTFSAGQPFSSATTGGFTSGSYISNPASASANFSSRVSSGFVSGKPAAASPVQVTVPQQNDSFVNTFVEPPPVGPKPIEVPSLSDQNGQYVDPLAQNNGVQLNSGYGNSSSALSTSGNQTSGNHRVYGKDQVSQLLSTLFPHR